MKMISLKNSFNLLKALLCWCIFVACNPTGDKVSNGEGNGAEVVTKGILVPITFIAKNGNDLGEVVVGSTERIIELSFTNNSNFKLTQIKLIIDEDSDAGMTFYKEGGGKGVYPGDGGDCSTILNSKNTCSFKIGFNPTRTGSFTQNISINYKNLIKKESKALTLKVTTGEVASLVFDDSTSFHKFGIFERTEPIVRIKTVTIENKGGLTAKNIQMNLTGNTTPLAFSLVENKCPIDLLVNEKCQISISYTPLNIGPFDLDAEYQASLVTSYEKDSNETPGALNSVYNFKAFQIEANYETNTPLIQFTPDLIVGNKESKTFKLTNKGYREGILKEIVFKDNSDQHWATCTKPISGDLLECRDNGNNSISLENFPFVLKDIDTCMDTEKAGGTDDIQGESCFFELTFWPSVAYQSNKDFSGSTIDIKFDSRYKGNETIKEKNVFNINATSQAAADVIIDTVTYNSGAVPNIGSANIGLYDMGRLALITSSIYGRDLVITLKNIGKSIATISSIKDGDNNPITSVLNDIGTYYKQTSHDCTLLGPGDSCKISFTIVPLFQNNSLLENDLMYDVNPSSITLPTERYKNIIISYDDETVFKDDGSLRDDSLSEAHLSAVLIQKGYLVYANTELLQGDIGILVSGNTGKFRVLLENVGTGPVPYIKIDDVKNIADPGAPTVYPFKIIQENPGAAADMDCFDIVDFNNSELGVNPDISNELPQGQKCALTVEMKIDDIERNITSNYPEEYQRGIQLGDNNTNDAWEFRNYSGSGTFVSFQYYDGDTSNPAPQLANFGNQYPLTDFHLNANFRTRAQLVAQGATPYSSAIIYRPPINLPLITDGTTTLNAEALSGIWINQESDGSNFQPIVRSLLSIPYASGLVDSSAEYTLHAGTFPSDGVIKHKITFMFENYGSLAATIDNITLTGGAGKFNLITGGAIPSDNVVIGSQAQRILEIEYTPTTTNLDSASISITFNDSFETVTKVVKVKASATNIIADDPADISFRYDNYSVSYDGSNTSELIDNSILAISTKYNDFNIGENIQFKAIKESPVYAKKRFYLDNISNVNQAEDIEINILENSTSLTNSNSGFGYVISSLANCKSGPLAALGTCWFEVTFTSTDGMMPSIDRYLHISYKIASNQYMSKMVKLQFVSEEPADLRVAVTNPEQVIDENSINRTSYPIDYGQFSDAGHIKAISYPTTKTITKTIVNLTNLKASFLPMVNDIPPPGDPVEIYNANDTTITASRACLFGDDEFDGGVPASEKGFNSSTIANCNVNITFSAYEKYIGKKILVKDNVIPIEFYNNARNSTDFVRIHLKGFIEPNGSTSLSNDIFNVESLPTGDVSFEWDAFTIDDFAWGSLTGYRVFYTEFKNQLDNIHDTSAAFIDVGPSTTNFSIGSLDIGKFYYFKVVGKRTIAGKPYLSESQISRINIIVPPLESIYVHDSFAIVDRNLLPDVGTRSDAIDLCNMEAFSINKNGAVEIVNKDPINTDIMDYLYTDPDGVSFSVFSDYNISIFGHHLSDSATDIEPIFTPYGFSSSELNSAVPAQSLFYLKSCSNASCNNLYKIQGGDGTLVPPGAILYNEGDITSFVRCFAPMTP